MADLIEVKIGSEDDFKQLSKLDYTNICDKMFEVVCCNNQIFLNDISLPKPIINDSIGYTREIKEDVIKRLKNNNILSLVVFYNNKPAGYLLAKWENWPNGKVVSIDGILVANKYNKKGLAKAMLEKLIRIAKQDSECRGIHVEMDTSKYQASKLLMKMDFVFAGTKFYIYSNKDPEKYSKEAIYFYYKIL
ncbi:MAG: GNAT family N-acetyltransferase [Planctomycetes bacterium]|jgi:ribosomal protein S18 acetylase RimI-like enzyme|nr:GNAT family N-acetyltransferase [Planctomycetota bacterium]